jgi:hypothetical protein
MPYVNFVEKILMTLLSDKPGTILRSEHVVRRAMMGNEVSVSPIADAASWQMRAELLIDVSSERIIIGVSSYFQYRKVQRI